MVQFGGCSVVWSKVLAKGERWSESEFAAAGLEKGTRMCQARRTSCVEPH